MKRTLWLYLWLVMSANLSAATYYASPQGGGDGRSYASPDTWSNALRQLQSGDSLYLLGNMISPQNKR